MTDGLFLFVFMAIVSIITSRFQNLYFNIKLHSVLPRVFRWRRADLKRISNWADLTVLSGNLSYIFLFKRTKLECFWSFSLKRYWCITILYGVFYVLFHEIIKRKLNRNFLTKFNIQRWMLRKCDITCLLVGSQARYKICKKILKATHIYLLLILFRQCLSMAKGTFGTMFGGVLILDSKRCLNKRYNFQ